MVYHIDIRIYIYIHRHPFVVHTQPFHHFKLGFLDMESPRGKHFFAFNEAVFSSSKRLAARNPVGVLAHSAGLCPLCV